MTVNLAIGPLVALLAGILILVVPRLLNFIIAIYLIIIGLVGIFGWNGTHLHASATDSGLVAIAPIVVTVAAPAAPVIDTPAPGVKGGFDDSQA